MSRTVLIIGPSGAGKSHSIQFLNPKTTFVVNVNANKDLPWQGSGQQYKLFHSVKNPTGNIYNSNSPSEIIKIMQYVSKNRPEVTDLIIDDHTHIYTNYYLKQEEFEEANSTGKTNKFAKFTHIAQFITKIIEVSRLLRKNMVVYIMHHVDETGDEFGGTKKIQAASFGKFTEEKLKGIETQFTIVLLAFKKSDEQGDVTGWFKTRDVSSSAKTPSGMFNKSEIPNNLRIVRKKMNCYYDGDC